MHSQSNLVESAVQTLTLECRNADTIDVALSKSKQNVQSTGTGGQPASKPPLCLNMANAYIGGGGWLKGALAQEEALCYRSSLSFTLKRRFYPLNDDESVYSPTVIIIRDSLATGHELLDTSTPSALPVISVVSVAALRMPRLDYTVSGEPRYSRYEDRLSMLEKMRIVLRVAGMHRQ
jgi:uncharacterized protein (TIGR02452 family)